MSKTLAQCEALATRHNGKLLSTKGKKYQWQCREGHTFYLTPYKVYRRGKWCPQCGASIGERDIRQFFREYNVPFIPQFRLPMIPSRKYDFYFEWNGRKYLVEFDGEQHFRFVKKYHRVKARFIEAQIIDRVKTWAAWNSSYHLIRIDYIQACYIQHHMVMALRVNYAIYFSTPDMYRYITESAVTPEQFQKYA